LKTLTKTAIGLALLVLPGSVFADQTDIGKREYEANCAVCHGIEGKGDGPLAEFLKQPPTSLTRLRKDSEGIFPFERVYSVIDGTSETVQAHGPRDMPIWGDEYKAEVYERHGRYYGGMIVEGMINGRILALISYIDRLQED
jgi:mono/diheme cytochrome c family protein